ncbi:hypothetical protein CLU79DRAFT_840935 [Phycomyces nitens]|nr:hypothetical protein CLU79DRAFT_840935 [Phycomyces nitens]
MNYSSPMANIYPPTFPYPPNSWHSSSASSSPTSPGSSRKRRSPEDFSVQDIKPRPRERRHRKAPHELLTDAEKKANHIASEQKRRQNIRLGFDQLIDSVPSLHHGNRSEALILQKSVEHIQHLITIKNDLKNQVRDLQSVLGDPNYEEDSSEDELSYSY